MEKARLKLARKFEQQRDFAAGYSPLYSRLFGAVAEWLSEENAESDPLARWLLEAAKERDTLDVTLLLAAGLHRDVLASEEPAGELAQYFPTAGGTLSPESPAFNESLRKCIMARREPLAESIRVGNVQTNETGRGLCWVLPSMLTGWTAIHLVDLGASAGLNLLADMRSFRLLDAETGDDSIILGHAAAPQFTVKCADGSGLFERLKQGHLPDMMSRIGCDIAPFKLQTSEDETILKSFIWGDQVERMDRLCEAIEVYKQIQKSAAKVKLFQCHLPEELGQFLEDRVPNDSIPVVIYNTFITPYLRIRGSSMADQIGAWASEQGRPVLWLQWEPARAGRKPPIKDMISWMASLWQGESYQQWQIGWVHPHGGEVTFNGERSFRIGG